MSILLPYIPGLKLLPKGRIRAWPLAKRVKELGGDSVYVSSKYVRHHSYYVLQVKGEPDSFYDFSGVRFREVVGGIWVPDFDEKKKERNATGTNEKNDKQCEFEVPKGLADVVAKMFLDNDPILCELFEPGP